MDIPQTILDRCTLLQAELHEQGIEATLRECHDLLVASALEKIRAKRLDTVSA